MCYSMSGEFTHEIQKEKIYGLPYFSFQKVGKLENKEATSLIFQNTEREIKQRTENYLVRVIIYKKNSLKNIKKLRRTLQPGDPAMNTIR